MVFQSLLLGCTSAEVAIKNRPDPLDSAVRLWMLSTYGIAYTPILSPACSHFSINQSNDTQSKLCGSHKTLTSAAWNTSCTTHARKNQGYSNSRTREPISNSVGNRGVRDVGVSSSTQNAGRLIRLMKNFLSASVLFPPECQAGGG
jgi:hypothetical protein